ncbi:deacetylases, including yeast histone deacetylase and acetoin utilization protein [Coriobacteriaceae bacterium EMTCatB1]|nr:deacetylases, including yeast histone deacetylase and acetoin utilization protein [Coriobacteriaceae bacterium EMTCatB1]
MRTTLVYSDWLTSYDFGFSHPLRPERFVESVRLMRTLRLLDDGGIRVVEPAPASEQDLLRVHDPDYVSVVKAAGRDPERFMPRRGIGPGDNPAFPDMHEAASLVAGAAITGFDQVLSGRADRALSIAGGLHHAHRDRAAGFCVYNDIAVGIAWALKRDPDLRIAYVDIDAHHGDGVQEAFWDDPRVLTASIHESGRFLFPGTGSERETGGPHAPDTAVNVPLEPYASDSDFLHGLEERLIPAVRAFAPDLLVTQNGADALAPDPLTHLALTLHGYHALVSRLAALSCEVCGGRMVAFGGGGYAWESVVPRAWTVLAYTLLEREVPPELLAEH